MAHWLITLQIQISIAVVAILLLRQAMKKLPKVYSYLLWLLVFARLLVPVSVETRFSFMPSEQEKDAFVAEVLENLGEEINLGSGQMPDTGNMSENILPQAGISDAVGIQVSVAVPSVQGSQVISPDDNSSTANGTFGNPVGEGTVGGSIMEGVVGSGSIVADADNVSAQGEFAVKSWMNVILLVVWGMGTAAVLSYNGMALLRMRRLLGKGESCQSVMVVHAVTGKEKSIPIYCCANLNTPFTLGLLKPAIYLPVGLNVDEQEYILCHERVHIGRKDNLVKHVAFLLTAAYWFNPFVWVAFFLMERDMEMSCDEKVLKVMGRDIKKNYSQSLLNFAKGRGKMPATHLTFGENSVKQRVKNVLSYKNAKKWSIAIGAVVLLVVVVALFTTGRNDVESDGPGNVVQDEESHDVQDGSGQELVDGQGSPVQGEQSGKDTPILTKESFESRYGQFGNYDFSVTGYGDGFYRSIMQQLFYGTDEATKEYCMKFTDPATAAVELLNLGEGNVSEIISDINAHYYVTEGAKAMVAYTFAQDNSVVEIPMVLIEGTFGIWAPEGTPVREVERMKEIWNRQKEDGTVVGEGWIEMTRYGIYRRNTDGLLTCLYPGYVNFKNDFHVYENILYFVTDSDYQEGDAEYQEDVVAMLDLNTLQVDRNTIPLNISRTTAPIQYMYGSDGLLVLWCNNREYHLPMVNTGNTKFGISNTFNGKAVADLTESEQDTYGVAVREQLLQNPGLLLELSNRTLWESYTFIDMDGDGKTEKILLMPDPGNTGTTAAGFALDNYLLKIGEASLTGHGDSLYNQLFAFSLDGKEIVIALQEDGHSGDPGTYFFLYRNGEVKYVGRFYSYITRARMEDGSIHTIQGSYVIQNDSRHYQYIITPEGELKEIEQEFYDLLGLNDIKLLMDLPVHSAPDSEDVTYMKPQTVHFTKVDNTGKWIYVEGEDGTGGWMLVGTFGWINELKKSSMDVFEGLNNAG